MKYAVNTAAAVALSLAVAALTIQPVHSQIGVTVTVDYSKQLGASEQMASGFLHGIGATHPAQYLIDGVKVTADREMAYVSGEAPGVTGPTEPGEYDPNLFDPPTYARINSANPNVALMAGLYYYVDASGETYWPGDCGNETTWRNTVADLYNYSVSHDFTIYSWLPWNEPDLQWNGSVSPAPCNSVRNTAAYYQAWLNAYQVIKGINPNAKVQGPETAGYEETYFDSFLAFCQANNALPDVLSWHALTPDAPEDIEADAAQIVSDMKGMGISPMPLAITEYAGGNPVGYNPGQITAYIARLERASREDGMQFGLNSNWDYSGGQSNFIATLGDQADEATATYPMGGWWVYNAYKDATGEAIYESSSNTNDVEAFAAYDDTMARSEIILGDPVGGSSSNVTLNLENLNDASALMNSGSIHLRVETLLTPDTSTGVLYEPTVALEGDYTVSGNALSVTLPTLASQNAYRILVNSAIATAPTTYYEAHLLPETNTAGVVYTTYAATGSRDGTATSLNATAVGDEITYTINVATAGVYDLRAGLKTGASHGMLQLYVNGTAVGGPKDQYNTALNFYNDDFGNVNLPAGNSTLELVAVNKNPSSSDYTMSFDYFELISLGPGTGTTGSFALAPSAGTLSVAEGASNTDTVTVTDAGGFTGSVTLATGTLPSGVTASFSPNPTTSTSVVTFTASSSATVGTSTVTITGTSGSLSANTTISITVTSSGSTLIPNGTYVITNVNSGAAIDDPDSSKMGGTDMQIYTVNDGANQQWTLTNLGNNVVYLKNVASGLALDVSGDSKSSGALVDQWTYSGTTNQQWNVVSVGGGNYELTSVNSGLALSTVGGGTANGTELDQLTYVGNASQQWKFIAP